jgi:hypothetical protein
MVLELLLFSKVQLFLYLEVVFLYRFKAPLDWRKSLLNYIRKHCTGFGYLGSREHI